MTRFLIVLVLAFSASASAATPSTAGPSGWVEAAIISFDEGLASAEREEHDSARIHFAESADAFVRAIDEHGPTLDLHRNAAAGFWLAGDVGRSIVHLRRASRLDPNDRRVLDALSQARASVRTDVAPDTVHRELGLLAWWQGRVDSRLLLGAGAAAYAVAWLSVLIAVIRRRAAWLLAGALSIAIAVAAAAPVWLADQAHRSTQHAVVVADEITGHNGPSAAVFPETFGTPLRAGVEARVLDERRGWIHIQLRDGRETWIPATAAERI